MENSTTTVDERDKKHKNSVDLKRVIKTIFLAFCWICLGLMIEVTGPTLIDLKTRTNSIYEDLATAVAGQDVGLFIGSIIGGFLVDKIGLYLELLVALALDVGAVGTIGIPWSLWTQLIWCLCCLQGIGAGVINTAGMKLLFNMWQEKATSPMHILHGGFGIGSFIIPLIASPFLAVSVRQDQNSMNYTTLHYTSRPPIGNLSENHVLTNTTEEPKKTDYYKPSRIEFAYLIPGIITICLSLVFHAYHLFGAISRKTRKAKTFRNRNNDTVLTFKQMLNPATCTGGHFSYGLLIFVSLILYFFNCLGGERIAGTFIRVFSVDYFGFTADDGTYLNTTFWISFTVGRFARFLAARWFSVRILVLIETCGILLSAISLVTFSGSDSTALWIIIQPIGFFTGPLFPSGMGWANFHLKITGVGITILVLGASIGAVAYMKMMGFLYDAYGPRTYMYSLLGYGISMFVISALLDMLGWRHSKLFTKESLEIETEETASGIISDNNESQSDRLKEDAV